MHSNWVGWGPGEGGWGGLLGGYLVLFARCVPLDCLQSAVSLKIRLVLDLIQRDCKPWCYYIGIERRQEKMDCWLFCSKQTLRQPRNRVTDWSIAQLLTDHWLVCGETASNKNSHTSQTTANNSEPSSNLSKKKFLKVYLTEGNCCKFPQGKQIQGNLTGFKESVIFSVVYVLFINRFKLLGFNWLIKLPWQLCCPQTEQKSQQSLIFLFFLLGLTRSFLAASRSRA